jgi:hypothetical protein
MTNPETPVADDIAIGAPRDKPQPDPGAPNRAQVIPVGIDVPFSDDLWADF